MFILKLSIISKILLTLRLLTNLNWESFGYLNNHLKNKIHKNRVNAKIPSIIYIIPALYNFVAQIVKNLPAIVETQVQSLGQEDPMEKGMATHSGILAWETPWTEKPGGLHSVGSQRVGHDWATFALAFLYKKSHHFTGDQGCANTLEAYWQTR